MSGKIEEEETKSPIISKLVGTAAYVAPEMILAAERGRSEAYRNFEEASKGDIYAFGTSHHRHFFFFFPYIPSSTHTHTHTHRNYDGIDRFRGEKWFV